MHQNLRLSLKLFNDTACFRFKTLPWYHRCFSLSDPWQHSINGAKKEKSDTWELNEAVIKLLFYLFSLVVCTPFYESFLRQPNFCSSGSYKKSTPSAERVNLLQGLLERTMDPVLRWSSVGLFPQAPFEMRRVLPKA